MKKFLFLLLAFLLILGVISNGTSGYFTDSEASAGNSFTAWIVTAITLLEDGFEGEPWDANWDGNGTTNWVRNTGKKHSGHYAAKCAQDNNGYLTSDDLDASTAVSINISFWFRPYKVEAGDMLVQLYNGSTYDTWCDLIDYPTWQDSTWCYFSEQIAGSQYFISDFRLRFDGSGLAEKLEDYNIDDVLITADQ